MVVCSICALSFIAMLAQYVLQSVEVVSKIHICFQIIIFVSGILLIRGLFAAKEKGTEGTFVSKDAALAPRDIVIKIKYTEKILTDSYLGEFNSLTTQLKMLRERMEYSLQDNETVRTNVDYRNLSEKALKLCSELSENINDKEYLENIETTHITTLINQVESISMLVRK